MTEKGGEKEVQKELDEKLWNLCKDGENLSLDSLTQILDEGARAAYDRNVSGTWGAYERSSPIHQTISFQTLLHQSFCSYTCHSGSVCDFYNQADLAYWPLAHKVSLVSIGQCASFVPWFISHPSSRRYQDSSASTFSISHSSHCLLGDPAFRDSRRKGHIAVLTILGRQATVTRSTSYRHFAHHTPFYGYLAGVHVFM